MKKPTILFILCLIIFFILLDLILNKPKQKKLNNKIENTGYQIISTPVPMNIREVDYVSNITQSQNLSAAADTKKSAENFITPVQEKNEYTSYLGDWIHGNDVKSVDDVMANGGLIVSFSSYDKNEQIIEGEIVAVQEPPISKIVSIKFQNKIKDGVIYFEFNDDEFENSGNGIITIDGMSVKISISTIINTEKNPEWSLASGFFVLKKAK